jgi:hypothetical protein
VRNGSHVIVGAQGRAYDGDKFLGGFDFDKALVRSATRILEAQGFKIGIDSFEYREPAPESLRSPWIWELLTSAEACKKTLSDEMEVQWTKDLIIKESGQEGTLNLWVTRQQFEEMIRPLINDTLRFCERALLNHASTAGETVPRRSREEQLRAVVEKLDKVILVGGSSLVPCVKHMIRTHFEQIAGRELEIRSFRPYECVGIGAAIYAETFRASKSKGETRSLFNWLVMPRERVGDEVGLHPELLGRVLEPGSTGSSLRYQVGGQSAAVEVGPDGSFRIPPFRLEPGENGLELTLFDDSGQVCGRESHRIVREGLSFTEPGLARPIFMRLLDGSIDLVPVGTRAGMVTQSDPLFVSDRSGKIRAPLYEGHHPIKTEEFVVDVPIGTKVVFQTRYDQGKLDMEVKIGDLAPLRTEVNLERLKLSDDRSKMWVDFMGLENKIARQLEDLPKDEPLIDIFKREQTALIFDIQTEFENPDILDLARLDDRIKQLEVLSWKIQAFSQTARGLKYRLDEVRKKIKDEGEDADLLHEIDELEAKLPEKDDLAIIVSLEAKLNDIWRRLIIRHPSPVDPSEVFHLEQQIRLKIERIYYWKGNDPKTEAILHIISSTFEKIVASGAEAALRVSRLWELEFEEVNPIYQEVVIRRGQEGLLSRTPRSDSG